MYSVDIALSKMRRIKGKMLLTLVIDEKCRFLAYLMGQPLQLYFILIIIILIKRRLHWRGI